MVNSGTLTPIEREQAILDNQALAIRVATAFWAKGPRLVDIEELKSEALVALVKAVDRWDANKDPVVHDGFEEERPRTHRLAPYLVRYIRWQLIRWHDEQTGGVYHNTLVKENKALPVKHVGLTVSMDDGEVERSIPDHRPNPEERLLRRDIAKGALSPDLDIAIKTAGLDAREQRILTLRSHMTLEQIAKKENLTRERIRQLLLRISEKVQYAIANPLRVPIPRAFHPTIADGTGKISGAVLRQMYLDQNMTLVDISKRVGVDHKTVIHMLDVYGIPRRKKTTPRMCKVADCDEPVYIVKLKTRNTFHGRYCRNHYLQKMSRFKLEAELRRDPLYGTRKCGRKPVPRPCQKCGEPCDSARLAAVHCLKAARSKELAQPRRTKFQSVTFRKLASA